MGDQTICAEPQAVRSGTLVERLCRLRVAVFEDAKKVFADYLPEAATISLNSSILNLAHYLALRRRDIREIQDDLAETGVSSLGRCESHVMATLDQVIAVLQNGYCEPGLCHCNEFGYPNYNEGRYLLERNAVRLFGSGDDARQTRIMVTLPTEAAFDDRLIHDLLARGMDCARINCAHDDRDVWRRMIEKITAARQAVGRDCKVLMDLAGQKIRTKQVRGFSKRICFKALHEDDTVEPLMIRLVANHAEASSGGNTLVVPEDIRASFDVGDRLFFADARGKPRWFDIVGRSGDHDWIGACAKTAVLDAGVVIEHQRRNGQHEFKSLRAFKVAAFPSVCEARRLFVGDTLLLYRREPEAERPDGRAAIGCTHSEIVGQLCPGHGVWFDDGKIGTRVIEVNDDFAELRVTEARPTGVRLRADKGINFPDLHLDLPCLTEKDLEDLDFICRNADMVGYSFVQSAGDMRALMAALRL